MKDIYHSAPEESAWGFFMKKLQEGRDARVNGRNSVWSQLQQDLRLPSGMRPALDIIYLDHEGGGTVKCLDTGKCYDFWLTEETVPAYNDPRTFKQRAERISKIKFILAE